MAEFEKLQDEVLQKLPLLTVVQLEECCTQLAIVIPAAKKGKRTAIRSLVLTHLSTEEFEQDEDVLEVLKTMNDSLTTMVEENMAKKAAEQVVAAENEAKVKSESSDTVLTSSNSSASSGGTTTKIELSRFKDWKVNPGTFGGESHVDYCSLCYQIEEAKELRFSEREIVSGMIKAMKDPLR